MGPVSNVKLYRRIQFLKEEQRILKERVFILERYLMIQPNVGNVNWDNEKIGIGDIVTPGPDMSSRQGEAKRVSIDEEGVVREKSGDIYLVEWKSGGKFWYTYNNKLKRILLKADFTSTNPEDRLEVTE